MPRATDPVEDAKAAELVQRLGLSETARQLGKGVPWVQRANVRHLATLGPAASPPGPIQPPLPGLAQPEGELDAVRAQEAVLRRLMAAMDLERRPREVGLLTSQFGQGMERLERLRAAGRPKEDRRGRVLLYLPARA